MSSASDIIIVWVHGAWHGPECFKEVGDIIAKVGYGNKYLSLPSVGSNGPSRHADEDSEYVRENVLKVLDEDEKDVVVVMHSYGGVPGSNAAYGLGKEQRKAEGKQTGIINLAYIASFVLPKDTSLLMGVGGTLPPWCLVQDGGYILTDTPEKIFYNDCSDEQIERMKKQLGSQSHNSFTDQFIKYESYKEIPSSYMICKYDSAIPVEAQERMIAASGPTTFQYVEKLDSSHSPFVSRVEDTARYVRKAAGEKL